jgi:outer membrane lipoprotein LolB
MTPGIRHDSARRRWLLAAAGALALGGCAAPPRIGEGAPGKAFERTGRFAVSVNYFGGRQEAVQGGFAWHDTARVLTLDLANPLGSTLARIRVMPGQAVLTRSDGTTESAPHPDALVELVLGSPIPVAGLRDWLRGRSGADRVSGLESDAEGRPTVFMQQGWRVQLSRYDALGPRLLQMNRNDANRTLSVRLVVDA